MLKLVALDQEDLDVVSAHVQDAVMKVEGFEYQRAARQFVLTMSRFAWESASGGMRTNNERRQSVLSFARVLSVKANGVDPRKKEEVLSLLALRFLPGEAPAGTVEFAFADNATIRIEVECIEARLTDTGGAWRATSRPSHKV